MRAVFTGSFVGPTAGAQGARRFIVFSRNCEKVEKIDGKSSGKALEKIDRWIERAALDPAYIGPIDVRAARQVFLRETASRPQATKIPSDAFATVHNQTGIALSAWKPSNIFDIDRSSLAFGCQRYALPAKFSSVFRGEK